MGQSFFLEGGGSVLKLVVMIHNSVNILKTTEWYIYLFGCTAKHDLSSMTNDGNCAPCSGSTEFLASRLPGKFRIVHFKWVDCMDYMNYNHVMNYMNYIWLKLFKQTERPRYNK